MSIREAIQEEMRVWRSHRSSEDDAPPLSYWELAKMARPPLPPSSVYRYLKGERDMTSKRCDRMLAGLSLALTPRYSTNLYDTIRDAITTRARVRKWSCRTLAEKAELPASTVSRFFADKMDLTSSKCDRLLAVLN